MSDKPTRDPVSKKTRFEVFKRDKFTCQYCGSKAPEVVLHADHIRPVADGGDSSIMNLVTACQACNAGKGARKLDDSSAVQRQRAQIEELEARRDQLEMMLEWRDNAQRQAVDQVAALCSRIAQRGDWFPNESGKADVRNWLKRYTLAELLVAMDASFDHYMKFDRDEPVEAAWNLAFSKIPAIASLRRQEVEKPYITRLAYIQGILRKRCRDRYLRCVEALESFHLDGLPLDDLEQIAKQARDWDGFCEAAEARLSAIGGGK